MNLEPVSYTLYLLNICFIQNEISDLTVNERVENILVKVDSKFKPRKVQVTTTNIPHTTSLTSNASEPTQYANASAIHASTSGAIGKIPSHVKSNKKQGLSISIDLSDEKDLNPNRVKVSSLKPKKNDKRVKELARKVDKRPKS